MKSTLASFMKRVDISQRSALADRSDSYGHLVAFLIEYSKAKRKKHRLGVLFRKMKIIRRVKGSSNS